MDLCGQKTDHKSRFELVIRSPNKLRMAGPVSRARREGPRPLNRSALDRDLNRATAAVTFQQRLGHSRALLDERYR